MADSLVKIDDTLFIVSETKEKQLQPLSEVEAFEAQVLEEDFEKRLQNEVHNVTNQAFDELKVEIKKNIKNIVLCSIGFENRWKDSWEVDHCNGRSSLVTGLITQKVQDILRKEMERLVEKHQKSLVKTFESTFIKEFKQVFAYEASKQVREIASSSAVEFAADLFREQTKKHQKEAILTVKAAFLGRSLKDLKIEDENSEADSDIE